MASKKDIIPEDQRFFLEILRNALHDEKCALTGKEVLCNLKGLLRYSSIHMVYPIVIDALYRVCPKEIEKFKKKAIDQTIQQASRTASFLLLYHKMQDEDLFPIVLKGIICRSLYREPETRRSVDEDLLIKPNEVYRYHDFLIKHGFRLAEPNVSLDTASELSYHNADNQLYLEVHKFLFSQRDGAYGELNNLFNNPDNTVFIPVYDTDIHTFGYTDHLLYMICHAYKHLIYSGIGIRQICDMVLFAETYGKLIDWNRITSSLKEFHLDTFSEALLKIAVDYLGMDVNKAECSHLYSLCKTDERPLLNDILSGGIYGAQDENRLHSANLTLSAVSAKKQGKKNSGLKHSLFPSFAYMSSNYSYLKKSRFLLPIAWIQRIYSYLKSSKKNIKPKKSIEIGKQRIELLKKYKLL